MVFNRKKKSDAVLDEVIVSHNPAPRETTSRPAPSPFTLVPGGQHVTIQFQEA